MVGKKSRPRTIYDVLDGPIPISCNNCGQSHSFNGKKEHRSYIACDCKHLVMLTDNAMLTAKSNYHEEIARRHRLFSDD